MAVRSQKSNTKGNVGDLSGNNTCSAHLTMKCCAKERVRIFISHMTFSVKAN
jgi:hypothetical protein